MVKKSDAAEAKTNGLTPNDLLGIVRELVSAQREIDEATGRKRAILKRAKSMGANLKALAAVQQMRKDPEDSTLYIRDLARYAKWLELPVFSQAEMFGDDTGPSEKAREDFSLEKAYDAGFHCGKDADDIGSNPYPIASEANVKWIEGWHAGQAANAPAEAEGVTRARTSRKRKPEPDSATPPSFN